MKSHFVPWVGKCPWCRETLSGATNASPGRPNPPKPGDFSVCLYCAQPIELTVLGAVRVTSIKRLPERLQGWIERMMLHVRTAPPEVRSPPSWRGL